MTTPVCPKCQAPVVDWHPYGRCKQCREPFSAEFDAQMEALRSGGHPGAGGTIAGSVVVTDTQMPPGSTVVFPAGLEASQLSRGGVWILLLIPLAFTPIFRLTLPYIGLWPAAALGVLSLLTLRRSLYPADAAVARGGLAVVLAVVALTFVATLGAGLPGTVPKLELTTEGSRHWWVKAASFLVLVLSISLHECAHALSAWYSGDSTARDAGRLTLNPIRHVDLFGTIILPSILTLLPGGFVFGWARPVPIFPDRFRDLRRGRLATSVSGVAANLTLALFFASCLGAAGVLLHLCYPTMTSRGFMNPWREVELAGLPAAAVWVMVIETLKGGVSLNMILLCLNILPVPPLDGYGLLEGLMPPGAQPLLERVRGWGPLLFLALIFTRALDYLLIPGALAALLLNAAAGAIAKLG